MLDLVERWLMIALILCRPEPSKLSSDFFEGFSFDWLALSAGLGWLMSCCAGWWFD